MKIKRKIAAVVLAVMALPFFSACDAEKGITITESAAKSVQTEKYKTADFSITIPKGWKVTKSNYELGNVQAELFANAPVLENPSTENFFKIFSQYGDFATKMESAYAGYSFPRYDTFTVTDRFASTSALKSYAIGDELIRDTFTDGGKEGEGMFSASAVDFGSFDISDGTVINYQL